MEEPVIEPIANIQSSFYYTPPADIKVTTLSTVLSSIETDLSKGDIFKIYLDKDILLANPINGRDGRAYTWWISQDTSTRNVTFDTKFKLPTSVVGTPDWSTGATAPSAMDMLSVRYDAQTDKYYIVAFVPGY